MSNSLVLVINSGSSSLKFALIDSVTGAAELTGLGECFGLPDANISWKEDGVKRKSEQSPPHLQHSDIYPNFMTLNRKRSESKRLLKHSSQHPMRI